MPCMLRQETILRKKIEGWVTKLTYLDQRSSQRKKNIGTVRKSTVLKAVSGKN